MSFCEDSTATPFHISPCSNVTLVVFFFFFFSTLVRQEPLLSSTPIPLPTPPRALRVSVTPPPLPAGFVAAYAAAAVTHVETRLWRSFRKFVRNGGCALGYVVNMRGWQPAPPSPLARFPPRREKRLTGEWMVPLSHGKTEKYKKKRVFTKLFGGGLREEGFSRRLAHCDALEVDGERMDIGDETVARLGCCWVARSLSLCVFFFLPRCSVVWLIA